MSCFLLSKHFSGDLNIMIASFWWARDCWLIPHFWLLPSSKQSISPIHTSLRPLSNQVHPTAGRAIFALPRKVITMSYRWKVGDGHPIMIWDDPWIPTPFSLRLFSPKPLGWSVSAVPDLINPFSKSWRHDFTHSLFTGREAESIRSIPLSIHSSKDSLCWHYEKKGTFSVRIVYHLAS